jgi:hypothetical protein
MMTIAFIYYLAHNVFIGNGNWDYQFHGPYTRNQCVRLKLSNETCIKLPKEIR